MAYHISRKNCAPKENIHRKKVRLLQVANICSINNIQNLSKKILAEFLENRLDAELDDELGYVKYDHKNKKTDTS